jgi:hypothetical protein
MQEYAPSAPNLARCDALASFLQGDIHALRGEGELQPDIRGDELDDDAVLIFQVDRGSASSNGETGAGRDIIAAEITCAHVNNRDTFDRKAPRAISILKLTVTPGIANPGRNAAALESQGGIGRKAGCRQPRKQSFYALNTYL